MWEVLEHTIPANVGMNFGTIAVLVVFIGGLIFYAKDFKLGITLHFIGFGALFMGLYALNYYGASNVRWEMALSAFLISFVIMAFTLYSMSKAAARGQII